jgi:allantoinase
MPESQIRWPNDARLAFVLGIAFEAWDKSKPSQGGALQSPLPKDALWKWDWSTETFRDFGPKHGLKRLLDVCDRYELKVSMPVNGLSCVYYPELIKYAHARGHELVAHGWDQGERLYMLTREQERENIHKTIDAIVKVTGERPTGWSSPGVRPTDNTIDLVVEAEMPYPIWRGDQLLVEFPHQYTINDHRMQEEGTRHEFFDKFKDEFDYRYKIGPDNPTMMNVITHAYVSSRIPLIDTFEQIVAYATSHKDVWLARRGDVAAWVRKQVLANRS